MAAAKARLDVAEQALTVPYRMEAIRSAARDMAAADVLLDQWLDGSDSPAACARLKGVSGFEVLAVFNRFNELSEQIEALSSFQAGGPWAADEATTAYCREREQQAAAVRQALPAEAAAAFLAFARVGEPTVGIVSPWRRESGPRYGYDVGRFVRVETITFGPGQAWQRHVDVIRRPRPGRGTAE